MISKRKKKFSYDQRVIWEQTVRAFSVGKINSISSAVKAHLLSFVVVFCSPRNIWLSVELPQEKYVC